MSRCRNSLSSLRSRKNGYRFLRGPIDSSDRYRSWGGAYRYTVFGVFPDTRELSFTKVVCQSFYIPVMLSFIFICYSSSFHTSAISLYCYLHFYPTFPWINLCSSSTWTFSSPSQKLDIHNKTSFTKSQANWKLPCFNYQSLIGGFNHLETYESQWEGLSHILWKIKHVWNHSIMLQLSIFIFNGKWTIP